MFEDFYGLRARPFQLTPDPAFYFESATHRKALSYLGYGLAQGEGFVVITGEVGAGKSTLVAHLMATIDPAQLTAALVVTSALDGEEIVHVVAQEFGLPVAGHDKASALGAIEHFLHGEARAGRRCLLIVDEAQNLSISAIEELRMLSNFQLGAHPLLQTLLLGQPEFRTTLLESDQLEQLRQRVIATHHLTAMTAGEVRSYVEHRLACVGWQGRPAFDDEVHGAIHAATGGIPRRINQVLNRLLLLGAVEQRVRIDVSMLNEVLGELDDDGAIALVSPRPAKAPSPAPVHAEPAGQAVVLDTGATAAMIESALAERDMQIDELQRAVLELAAAAEHVDRTATGDPQAIATLQNQLAQAQAQVARLETRVEEQEATLRHMLTMLIEWFEGGEGHRAAA
ncbi:putative secretion ATPase (PEP-CTERM system associated) [Novosphingobium sp. PhB165]|uniref:XrtA/PEP-CTERM system-associated ATPase n=1 Tax=Novosphingobium sp. PhB165 TaxID=2485105 RepID=UPI00104C3ED8|nr:XrtA/PEP-CTERM system-associated ATPase [Novosphingobium sp. PhB165]TCM22314.1 putative secretion ATPase (PEP-CTERM system associated) [Novosphingobium sp. PhB165]